MAGKHLAQGPLNPLRSVLDDPDLLRLFLHVGRVEDRLQRVANMVVHLGNHAELAEDCVVPVQLIGKNHEAGHYADEQVVNKGGRTLDAGLVQDVLQQHAQQEHAQSQQETYSRAAQERGRL